MRVAGFELDSLDIALTATYGRWAAKAGFPARRAAARVAIRYHRAMPDYTTLKTIHVAAAAISIAGFMLRYVWMIVDSRLLGSRAAKVLPHLVDTVLLVSAIWLAAIAGIAPWSAGWLGYKVVALVVYVVLGAIALKRGRTRSARIVSGALAIAVFATIVWVARNKTLPVPGFW